MIFEVNKRKHLRSPFARKYIIVFHWLPLRLFLSEALIGLNGKHIQEHDKMATKLLTSKLQGRKKLLKIKFVKHFAFYNWAKSSRKPFIITLLFFFFEGKDILVSLPTGYDKSVISQAIPAITWSLKVLMEDQVQYLVNSLRFKTKNQIDERIYPTCSRTFT